MNNFKEAYADDLKAAFFDEEEFASVHTIDGEACTIILTDVTSVDAKTYYGSKKSALNPKETAINRISHILYIRDTELKRKFTSNALINLDGKRYFVQDVKHMEGMYRLAIGIHAV